MSKHTRIYTAYRERPGKRIWAEERFAGAFVVVATLAVMVLSWATRDPDRAGASANRIAELEGRQCGCCGQLISLNPTEETYR